MFTLMLYHLCFSREIPIFEQFMKKKEKILSSDAEHSKLRGSPKYDTKNHSIIVVKRERFK